MEAFGGLFLHKSDLQTNRLRDNQPKERVQAQWKHPERAITIVINIECIARPSSVELIGLKGLIGRHLERAIS